MKKNSPTNQHWVPKFYLDNFATPETINRKVKHVNVLRNPLDSSDKFTSATESVCGKRYLYTPLNDDGTRDRKLDDLFDRIETQGADAFRAIKRDAGLVLDHKIREFLALFVATMHLRNLKMVDLIRSTIDTRNKLYGMPTAEEMESRDEKVYDLRNPGKAFIQFFAENIEKLTEVFHSQKWTVLTTTSDVFITSDKPVSISNKYGTQGGPHTKGAVTVFPLMPHAVLVMGDDVENGDGMPIAVNIQSARSANSLVRLGSMRFLITGRPADEVIAELRHDQPSNEPS